MESYTWTNYDAREGGTQVLKDGFHNVQVTTELLKVPGGQHGGSWAVRIKGKPTTECESLCSEEDHELTSTIARPMRTSFIYYLGIEGMGGLELDTKLPKNVSLCTRDIAPRLRLALEGYRRRCQVLWI